MIKLPRILMVLAFCCSFGYAQTKAKIVNEIQTLMQEQEKAWNNFDIDGFMKHYWNSDSLMFVGKTITYGWKQTMANYKKNYSSKELMGVLAFTNLKFDVYSKDIATVVGKWEISRPDGTKVGGHYSLLWKRMDGKLVIVRDHTS